MFLRIDRHTYPKEKQRIKWTKNWPKFKISIEKSICGWSTPINRVKIYKSCEAFPQWIRDENNWVTTCVGLLL